MWRKSHNSHTARRFSDQYYEFGMYRDTSLKGATRAKELIQLRQQLEAKRIQEAKIKLKEKEREERKAMALALKVKLRQIDRQQRQLEAQTRNQAAYFLQCLWRDYANWKKQCLALLMLDSAQLIQRVYRGLKGRQRFAYLVLLNRTRGVINVQRIARGRAARRKLCIIIEFREKHAIKIQKTYRGLVSRNLFEHMKRTKCAIAFQSVTRQYFAQQHVSKLRLQRARRRAEASEAQNMAREDEASRIIEYEERERILMRKEDLHTRHLQKHLKQLQAAEQGIPLLPWRKKRNSFRDVLLDQKRQRREQKAAEEKARSLEKQRLAKEKADMLKRVEEDRQKALRKALRQREKQLSEQARAQEQDHQRRNEEARRLKEEQERMNIQRAKEDEEKRIKLLKANRRRLRVEREKEEQIAKEKKAAEQQRMALFEKREQERLLFVRKKAAEKAKVNIENEQQEEKRKLEEKRAKAERAKKLAQQESMERQRKRERMERVRAKRLKKQEELEKQMQEQAEEKKRLLQEKAKLMRLKIRQNLQSKRVPMPPALRTNPAPRRRKKNKHRKRFLEILQRTEDVLLPQLENINSDPLSRALEWKRKQQQEEERNDDDDDYDDEEFDTDDGLSLPAIPTRNNSTERILLKENSAARCIQLAYLKHSLGKSIVT